MVLGGHRSGSMHERTFKSEVFLVLQPICAPLEDPDLVVEPLDEAERDLVLWSAVHGDAGAYDQVR